MVQPVERLPNLVEAVLHEPLDHVLQPLQGAAARVELGAQLGQGRLASAPLGQDTALDDTVGLGVPVKANAKRSGKSREVDGIAGDAAESLGKLLAAADHLGEVFGCILGTGDAIGTQRVTERFCGAVPHRPGPQRPNRLRLSVQQRLCCFRRASPTVSPVG